MVFLRLLPLGLLLAITSNAADSSSSSTNTDVIVLTGATEGAIPTDASNYQYYSTTKTVLTTSAITTSAIVSTITTSSSTIITTLGSTTLFGTGTVAANASSSTSSQIYLQGSMTATVNGTSNGTATSTAAQVTNTQPCNNYPEFCERSYGNITEVSTHNSPFIKAGNVAANQDLSIQQQLNDGIRMLQGQMHIVDDVPHFCHTSCDILDAGPIETVLREVTTWVSSHPYDVVTILLGNGVYTTPASSYTSFIEASGLVTYAYVPPKIPMALDDWPTLASMILTGKRVVMFMDYNANQTAYPWLLDEFSQIWETPFDPTNRTFPCNVQRPPDLSTADANNRLYLINHNLNFDITLLGNSLLVPYIPLLNVTNNVTGEGSLGVAVETCQSEYTHPPKFLNVDFYNVGDPNGSVFDVQATLNGVNYTRSCCGLVATADGPQLTAKRSILAVAFGAVLLSWMLV